MSKHRAPEAFSLKPHLILAALLLGALAAASPLGQLVTS